jgi:APA family basic amino acid/polyamine antiporter
MKKVLTYIDVLMVGIGYILGAGIYALLGVVANYSGNMIWLSILITGIVTLVSAYSYMQLAKDSDQNESEYNQLKEAFGYTPSITLMVLSIISVIFSCATISIGFGNYLESLTGIPSLIGGILVLVTSCYLNIYGVRQTININTIMTFAESLGLIIIIIAGYSKWNGKVLMQKPKKGYTGLFYGSYLFSFAFFGFETLIRLSEETIDSQTVIPAAIRDSILLAMLLYILVSISSISLIGYKKLSSAMAPLSEVIKAVNIPYLPQLISVIALSSSYNTVLMSLLTNSRILYGLVEKDALHIPFLDKIGLDIKKKNDKQIPVNSLIINAILSILVMILIPSLEKTTFISNIGIIALLIGINIAYFSKKYNIKFNKIFSDNKESDKDKVNIQLK